MIRRATLAAGALALLLGAVQPAWAIPPFARKYGVSCSMCHAPAPRLTAFGERFAENGFEMMPGEPPRDTVQTGDPLLRLPRGVPLGVRIDAYAQMHAPAARDRAAVDLQLPHSIKVLSGGPIADKISYYMYFFLSERGEVKGLEDAYLRSSRTSAAAGSASSSGSTRSRTRSSNGSFAWSTRTTRPIGSG